KSKWVGQRQAKLMRASSLVGVKGHVEHPEGYEPAKPINGIRRPNQSNKDSDVRQAFDELAVVHRADARNESQHCRQTRAGKSHRGRRSGALRNRTCARCRCCRTEMNSEAVLA